MAEDPPPTQGSLDRRLVLDALVQVSFRLTAILSQVAAANDLSLTQLRVLAILEDHEPRMSELADHLGLDRSSVSGLIDRAVIRDLVQRTADDSDGRSTRVTLTPKGREFAETLSEEVLAQAASLLSALVPARQSQLATLLQSMLAGCQTQLR